ncbi:MAG: hypothetical protein MI923_08675 [Phycisphaerales bacterium]|nr:hypothetical protein [Phycisphaerales bacterium]
MQRLIRNSIGFFLGVGFLTMAGCASTEQIEPVVQGTPAMLFDRDTSRFAATNFGRSPWPATLGRIETVEETVFVESYFDNQGNATQERNNPRRWFRSYRVGTQLR